MDIQTIASGSHGNAYTVTCNGSTILIECGVPIKELRKGCGYKLSQVDFCLLSHEHADHSKAAKDVMAAGIDLYCSVGTAYACGLSGHRLHAIRAFERVVVGNWRILPFNVEHDAEEPLGFLIANGNKTLLFATDTMYLRYRFNGITHIMLECNYSVAALDDNLYAGDLPQSLRARLLHSHMSLEQCRETLLANDLSKVEEIHLLHLSFLNADADGFKREIQRATGKLVVVAGKD